MRPPEALGDVPLQPPHSSWALSVPCSPRQRAPRSTLAARLRCRCPSVRGGAEGMLRVGKGTGSCRGHGEAEERC